MNAGEFDRIMSAMESTFTKKISADTRMMLWPLCQDIPSNCAESMRDRLCDLEKFPSNMGRAIREAHRASSSAPISQDVPRGCQLCDGPKRGGCITVAKLGQNGRYTISAAHCAACYPASPHKSTKQALASAGYDLCMSADRAAQSAWWSKIQRANTAHLLAPTDGGFVALIKDRARIAAAARNTPDEQGIDTRPVHAV